MKTPKEGNRIIKAFALLSKKTGKICRVPIHVLKTDCPYCIYETEDFLEGDKDIKIVPVEIKILNQHHEKR